MSIVVVGSVGLDTVKTPFGERKEALGGSAIYFSYAASFFTDVQFVGVVGQDFPSKHLELLKERRIDLQGLMRADGNTFRWSGSYEYDLNEAKTLSTQLNVLESFHPQLPEPYLKTDCLFLANISPDLQMEVLDQMGKPQLVACDTMNLWIQTAKPSLLKLLPRVDIFILNDSEARMITGQPSLIRAGRQLRDMGVKHVVIKKGEHGAILFSDHGFFTAPSYPIEEVFDPTGAGDSFAGGFLGYLNQVGNKLDKYHLHRALAYGTIIASFNVEDFSLDRLKKTSFDDVEARFQQLRHMTSFP